MPPLKAGYFQIFDYPSETEVLIRDELYGDHLISEPVLVALLHSQPVLRLQGICQHGVTGFLGHTRQITRLEHSVGAFLLVRILGARVDEQVAALLHDISHTTLSHVVDWALSKPGEESFHEVHKDRYVRDLTDLPRMLGEHGLLAGEVLDESLFPLVEQPAPHLCADRLDYALRDAVGFGKLSLDEVRRLLGSLRAFPDCAHPGRLMVLEDVDLALRLSRAYIAVDREVWSNRAHLDMYRRTGAVIRNVIRQGAITEEQLWKHSDWEFWELLRRTADEEDRRTLERLESEGLPDEGGLSLPTSAKVRTIDPDVYSRDATEVVPLSKVLPSWAAERQEYIHSREMTRG
ncbi:uncharacterized protein BJX67DRAFT_242704 [Aspergillus lucknowensis]|uniref:HD/PDEase domain-containing protein n=1 Tax=Aspergillus lucknowensis TaxID=176173 RepID=A0ABR4M1B6_9EURO